MGDEELHLAQRQEHVGVFDLALDRQGAGEVEHRVRLEEQARDAGGGAGGVLEDAAALDVAPQPTDEQGVGLRGEQSGVAAHLRHVDVCVQQARAVPQPELQCSRQEEDALQPGPRRALVHEVRVERQGEGVAGLAF